MSDPLLAARAAVLHDLAAWGLSDPETVSMVEDVLTERRWWVEEWPDGAAYVAGLVAQDVQDRLLETTARWPLCTTCPPEGSPHELRIEPELGADPHWVCEKAGLRIAPLGALVPAP